jgi:ribosomal protein S12 methylthiotransferase accessory factor
MHLDLSGVTSPSERVPPAGVHTETATRSEDPTAMRSRLAPRLARFGVTRVACVSGLDRIGLPVFVAARPQARTLATTSSKGLTRDASWVSAVMEAAEQSVWESLAPSELVATEGALAALGARPARGDTLPRRARTKWHEAIPVRWTAGWDVVHGEEVYVPDAIVCSYDDPMSPFVVGTNGLASGAHVLEAILSGVLEAVERDGLTRTREDPSLGHLDPTAALERCAPAITDALGRAGVRISVIEGTTDVGIPTYACHLTDGPDERLGAFLGAGANTSPAVALVRAVVEAVQSRTAVVAGARDDVFTSVRRASIAWPAPGPTRRGDPLELGDEGPRPPLLTELEGVVRCLVDRGFERVIVFRHTGEHEAVQVVRVVVPGLEGYPSDGHAVGARGRAWRQAA